MQILILQGSPRAKGNTAWMAEEYKNAAEAAGHNVTFVNVSHKHIAGCLAKGVKVIMGEDANPLSDDYDGGYTEPEGQGEPKNLIPWDKLAEFFNKNLK